MPTSTTRLSWVEAGATMIRVFSRLPLNSAALMARREERRGVCLSKFDAHAAQGRTSGFDWLAGFRAFTGPGR